jgi:hypothetical protein
VNFAAYGVGGRCFTASGARAARRAYVIAATAGWSDVLQQRTWGGPERDGAQGVAVAKDGSVYVTGSTRSFGAGGDDAMLLRYGANGRLRWQRTYGTAPDPLSSGEESGIDVTVAPDNSGVLVLGNYRDGNIFLAKFNPAGTLMWNRTWGGNHVSREIRSDGSVIWEREWGLVGRNGIPGETQGTGVAAAPAGGAYVSGSSTGAGADPNLLVARFDAAGNFVWQRVGGPGFGNTQDIAVGPEGNVHVTGSLLAPDASGSNAFVWTVLANGRAKDASVWVGNDPFEGEHGESIATAADGTILVAGSAGASPYTFSRGSKNAKAASTFLATIRGTITTPAGEVGIPAAAVQTPAGSETFAGVSDAFLLRVQP